MHTYMWLYAKGFMKLKFYIWGFGPLIMHSTFVWSYRSLSLSPSSASWGAQGELWKKIKSVRYCKRCQASMCSNGWVAESSFGSSSREAAWRVCHSKFLVWHVRHEFLFCNCKLKLSFFLRQQALQRSNFCTCVDARTYSSGCPFAASAQRQFV